MNASKAHLETLAAELEQRGFNVLVRHRDDRSPTLTVVNPHAPALTEKIMVATDTDQELAYFFPWPARIAPVTEPAAAADRIAKVLAEVGA